MNTCTSNTLYKSVRSKIDHVVDNICIMHHDIVVFCLTSHSTMKTIDHGTDKRNIQELTKLSVKASIKEEKESQEWTKHCLIFRDYYNRQSRRSPQKSYKPSAAELIFGLVSMYLLHYIVTFVHFI